MKQIIRITEKDLHGIIKESVQRILEGFETESGDEGYLDEVVEGLQYIDADEILDNPEEIIVPLNDDYDENGRNVAYISCSIDDNRIRRRGWESNDIDLPDDPSSVEGNCVVVVNSVIIFDDNYEDLQLQDDGRIENAIKEKVCVPDTELDFADDF